VKGIEYTERKPGFDAVREIMNDCWSLYWEF